MQRGNREWYDRLLNAKSPREQVQLKEGLAVGGRGRGVWQGAQCEHSVNPASVQPGPQRLAGLVELVDTVYEDLQSCYSIYASLFHRWPPGLSCRPCAQPLKCCHWGQGLGSSRCLRCVLCSIIKIDFFTLTFRQLERLVRQGDGESLSGREGAWVSLLLAA